MTEKDILKKIAIAKAKPETLTDLRPSELADLVLVVLEYVKQINQAIDSGKIKGEKGKDAPILVPDKDYLSLPTARTEIQAILNAVVDNIEADVQKALSRVKNGKDGKDAKVTREHIEEAAKIASGLIQIPDFPTLITQEPEAIRNALELLKGDERLSIKAIDGIDEILSKLEKKLSTKSGGGAGARAVKWLNDITNASTAATGTVLKKNADGSFSFLAESGGASSDWGDIGGTLSDQTDLQAALDAKANSLGADDNYVTDAEKVKLSNLSGTNTGDQNLTPYFHKTNDDTDDITVGATNKFATAAEKTKLGHITVTQAVDLDQIESDTVTNNAKVSNATHTGEVTGSTVLTVDKTAISNKTQVTAAIEDTVLIGDASDSNNLKKVTVQTIADLASGSGVSESLAIAYAVAL